MKNTTYIYLVLFLLSTVFVACEVEGIDDLEQPEPVVLFESDSYNASIILTDVDNIPEVQLRLMGQKLEQNIQVNIEIDEANTTAIIGTEFTLDASTVTILEGESFANVPFTIDRDALEADVNKTVGLIISSVNGPARNADATTQINLKKTIVDLGVWLGDYTFYGDGWDSGAELRAVDGENYKLILHNFWDNGLDMEGTVDVSDPTAPKLIVPAGTFLSYGWDDMGDWYLKNDLIGVFDKSRMEIVFTQFDYITDDGSEGSFPWCSELCKIVKN